MAFCLDAIQFDVTNLRLFASFKSLLEKVTLRRTHEAEFKETGGRYIRKLQTGV